VRAAPLKKTLIIFYLKFIMKSIKNLFLACIMPILAAPVKAQNLQYTIIGKLENFSPVQSKIYLVEPMQVSDLIGWKNGFARLYDIRYIPQNFLIDPNGVITGKNLRGEELDAKLAALFQIGKFLNRSV
jgi:hypothetical protein